jgi:hypothetical protein
MKLERLRELSASTLALHTTEGLPRDEIVLVRSTTAGDFMLGGSITGNGNVWLREVAPLRLRGLSAQVTFTLYADTCTPYSGEPRRLRVQSLTRCDGRAVTRTQHSTVDELTREVFASVQCDLPALWAAIEWRQVEARIAAVAAELEALAIERGALREKLAGVRPW